jgi:ligand-binding sensor domain-containing protein
MLVYTITQHNDTIYFSTSDSGIFGFPADSPAAMKRLAYAGHLPIRSIAFASSGMLYAGSYNSGVRYFRNDTLLPLPWAPQLSWSIKFDEEGSLWLAGTHGIYRQRRDSLVVFNTMNGGHDIAFCDGQVAIAHMGGISVFDMKTGALVREFCKGVICWTIARYDSLFIGGGLNLCVIIHKENCRKISLGPQNNMLWSAALDRTGTLYMGTQEGLYCVKTGGDEARCIGLKGVCIKSVLLDNKGRLWVGRFNKYKK